LADGAALIGRVGYCTQDEMRDEATNEASTEAGEIKFDKLMEKRKTWAKETKVQESDIDQASNVVVLLPLCT
jgi:hypothetical protein